MVIVFGIVGCKIIEFFYYYGEYNMVVYIYFKGEGVMLEE